MATALDSNSSECCICYERFTIPKNLTCGHTFCLGCIERFISDKTETFPCPICQQDVVIPVGGAKDFTTNFIVQTSKHTTKIRDQPPSTTQPKCQNHNQREVDYYCNNCNVGLCFKCIHVYKKHSDHPTLDIECDETRIKAIEKLEHLHKIIENRIKNLEKTRSILLESFEYLELLCENSCARVTKKAEKIVSDVKQQCEQIIENIRKNLEVNRRNVEDREMEITKVINSLESYVKSNFSKTTLNILQTVPCLVEVDKHGDSRIDFNLSVQYLQWVGTDFSLGINPLGSVISKSDNIPGSYQFLFYVSDFEKSGKAFYNRDLFRNNKLVWSCGARRQSGGLYIYTRLLPDDNPELDYCVIDFQVSLLNIDDNSKSIINTVSDKQLKCGGLWSWYWRVLPLS